MNKIYYEDYLDNIITDIEESLVLVGMTPDGKIKGYIKVSIEIIEPIEE